MHHATHSSALCPHYDTLPVWLLYCDKNHYVECQQPGVLSVTCRATFAVCLQLLGASVGSLIACCHQLPFIHRGACQLSNNLSVVFCT
jgi:hypothetical protein